MKKQNVKSKRICNLLLAGVFFLSAIPNLNAQEQIPIKGEWDVFYEERALGGVSGRAVVSDDESSAKVELIHPETGAKYVLNSSSFSRDGDNVEMVLEGKSPESEYQDGQGYPQKPIIISEQTSKVTVKVGQDNKTEKAINPRKLYDLDRVKVKLSLQDAHELHGTWRYKADPITERDQKGFGRVGQFDFSEGEESTQTGWEIWVRPKQLIVGAFPINNQLHVSKYVTIYSYPHPFQNNEYHNKGTRRNIFIFGENLPKDISSAIFESGSEFVTYGAYGGVKFPDSVFLMPGNLNPFVIGKKKLFENTVPEEHEALSKLDFMVVEVKMKEGVKPGLQSFKLNGEEATWILKFGDNRAEINFVRKINPEMPMHQTFVWTNTETGEEILQEGTYQQLGNPNDSNNPYKYVGVVSKKYENTHDIFIPEITRIEVRTELILQEDDINVTVGKNGKSLKFGSSVLIPARRTSDDPRVYRTDPIAIIKSSGSTLPESGPHYDIAVKNGDVLFASIAENGLISIVPPPDRASIHTSPGQFKGRHSFLWKDYLLEAGLCYDTEIEDWDRDNYEHVAEISERLVLEGKLEDLEIVGLAGIVKEIFFGTELKTHFQLGDHAAMLLMRQMFLEMIEKTIYNFANQYRTDEDYIAFRHYINPYRWQAFDHPITKPEFDIEVTGKDGQKMDFFETFGIEDEDKPPEEFPWWLIKATREAIDQYIQILFTSKQMAEEIESCDIEGMLKLTGNTFDAVEDRLTSRIMKLDTAFQETGPPLGAPGVAVPLNDFGDGDFPTAQPQGPQWTSEWKPDYQARFRVNSIASKFDQMKMHQNLSDQDTQNLIAATAVLTLPVLMVAGPFVATIVGISEVLFESYIALDNYLESTAEIEFATGTADVLGHGRYRKAKAEEFDYLDLTLQVGMALGMEVAGGKAFEVVVQGFAEGIGKTFNFFRKGLHRLRAIRGKALLGKYNFDIDALPATLKPRQLRDIGEYIISAARLRQARRILDDDQMKVISFLDRKAAEFNERPSWAKDLDELTHNDLKEFYSRDDIENLIKTSKDVVVSALRGADRGFALRVLKSTPNHNGEQFLRAIQAKKNMVTGHKTARYMDQVSETDVDSVPKLKKGHWHFETDLPDEDGFVKMTVLGPYGSPNNAKKAFVIRSFEDGTFTLKEGFIHDASAWINVGLDVPLVPGKGVPTIQFMTLRLMKKFGIGFAGSGEDLHTVILFELVNTRMNIHVHWLHTKYFPTKALEEIADNPKFSELLMETPTVVFANDLLKKAGYEITGVRLNIDIAKQSRPSPKGVMTHFKVGKDGETAEEFLKRFGLPDDARVPINYDIELKVKAIRGFDGPGSGRPTGVDDIGPGPGSDSPHQPIEVDEFDPTALDDLETPEPHRPLEVDEFDPNAEHFDVDGWWNDVLETGQPERIARERAIEELMERRANAPRFTPKEGGTLRNDNVGYLVHGDNPRLKNMMQGYKARQPHVFVGNINKYAQDMIENKIIWDDIHKLDRIVMGLDGKTVVRGHHRFVAAHLASQATGRPVRGGSNPILPDNAFGPPQASGGSLQEGFDIKVLTGFKTVP